MGQKPLSKATQEALKSLNAKTEKALLKDWLGMWEDVGATYHHCDIERFHKFALEYCKHSDNLTKDQFVEVVKFYTPKNVAQGKRGIAQDFYTRLSAIKGFYTDTKM